MVGLVCNRIGMPRHVNGHEPAFPGNSFSLLRLSGLKPILISAELQQVFTRRIHRWHGHVYRNTLRGNTEAEADGPQCKVERYIAGVLF
jgi:hypothetical protein